MKILVVDAESEVREMIHLFLESTYSCTISIAESASVGLELLKTNPDFACIISDFAKNDPAYMEMHKHLVAHFPKTPFILCSDSPVSTFEVFKKRPPFGSIDKSHILESLNQAIQPIMSKPNPSEYVRISIGTVMRHGLLSCDLYIKVNEYKYLKVMREGDTFEAADFFRFDSKKMDFLYIRAEDSALVLDRMTQGIVKLSGAKGVSGLEQNIHISTNVLGVIADFNKTLGFTPEVQKLTQESISLAIQSIRKNPDLSQLFSQMSVDPDSYLVSHSVTLAHVSCGIASLLKWTSGGIFYKLSLAAFLHDLTLHSDRLAAIDSTEELREVAELTADEVNLYLNHPQDAADMSKLIADVPPEVTTIIQQHHEQPTGTGFPNQLNHVQIHPLSAVFIVAERVIAFRSKVSSDASIVNIIDSLAPTFKVGHFKAVTDRISETLRETMHS